MDRTPDSKPPSPQHRLGPQEIAALAIENQKKAAAEAARQKILEKEVAGRLLSNPDYVYLKLMAQSILQEYECAPAKNDSERTKWETYNTLLWFAQRLFAKVDIHAPKQPLPTLEQ